MPSEYVKKQLLSLEFAIPDSFDKETNTYHIPRYRGPVYTVGKCYLVHFDNKLTNELLLSWNNSCCPNTRYLKIAVNTKLGKMIKVDAVEITEQNIQTNVMWFGWLNSDYLEQLSILN